MAYRGFNLNASMGMQEFVNKKLVRTAKVGAPV